MTSLFECVPNISEGRRLDIIDLIGTEIRTVKNLYLLNVDSNASANRSVFTFVGTYDSVLIAAEKLVKLCIQYLDMHQHKGAHPRIGLIDVFPIIALKKKDENQAIHLAKKVGEMLCTRYQIPVYYYQKNAIREEYKELEAIRRGNYESLDQKWKQNKCLPDLIPKNYNAKTGATVVGVRDFLIAYNINLKCGDSSIAKKIAKAIRTSGDNSRPHKMDKLKAIGWWIKDFDCAQVSTNLVDYNQTNMHHVYEIVQKLAAMEGVELNGSELIGLVPKEAIIMSGGFYASGKVDSIDDLELIALAVDHLGLNSVKPFEIHKNIIELNLDRQITWLNSDKN